MSAEDYMNKSIRLQTLQYSDDGAGGQTSTWTTQCTLRVYVHGKGVGSESAYERDGLKREIALLVSNDLPTTVDGHRTLQGLLNKVLGKRVRFLVDSRTLSFDRMEGDGQPQFGANVLRLLCIETPQSVGYMDK